MADSTRPPLIHVGYHKTGTTWLQKRLFASGEAGFCSNTYRRDSLHTFVYPHPLEFDPAEARAYYEADWQRYPPGAVPVVSMERFSGTPHAGRYDSVEIAHRLYRTFPEGRVLIVVREQDDMILSSYRQYVKNSGGLSLGGYLHPPYEPSVIHQFSYGGFHYDRLVAVYDALFGAENVLVLPYEAFREDPVTYMERITRFAGLDPSPESLERLRPGGRENASLSALATALKRWANRLASRRSAINPTPLVTLSERGATVVKRAFYKLDRWLPNGVSRRLDARQRAFLRGVVGTRYQAGNAALAARMGTDLGRYGYRMPEAETADRRTPAASSADDPLTFHIIYTPGTVELLSPFVRSLLAHSPFHYCLVANGCEPEERERLSELAATSPRLSMRAVPADEVQQHSTVMDWLFAQTDGSHFAFLDSDVFATAPFGEAVIEALAEDATAFACAQPWASDIDRSVAPGHRLAGRHLWAAGRPIGTTFFAVYERACVERIRDRFGVGFGKYAWDDLPEAVRARFVETDLRFKRFDTAKALNLLLRTNGVRLRTLPLPAVVHLGGVSDRVKGARRRAAMGQRSRWHPAEWGRTSRDIVRVALRIVFPPRRQPFRARRALAWHYFADAIPALQAGRPLPPIPDFGDVLVQREMERVIGALAAFYAVAPVAARSLQEAA